MSNFAWKIDFFNCLKKSKYFENLSAKNRTFVKLPERIKISQICLEKSNFFYPDPRPLRFQTRLTPPASHIPHYAAGKPPISFLPTSNKINPKAIIAVTTVT